jgi:thymidine kinase
VISHFFDSWSRQLAIKLDAWLIAKGYVPERQQVRDENEHNGRIIVITGEMFSGKTEELIRLVRRNVFAKVSFATFKPRRDTRESGLVKCRNGHHLEAIEVGDSKEILRHIVAHPEIRVVGVDEAQFFDEGIVEVLRTLADIRHITVIVAGLDMDFEGKPFGPVPGLMAIASEVRKVHAVCVECGRTAAYSRRKVPDTAQIVVGYDGYEAVCRAHRSF